MFDRPIPFKEAIEFILNKDSVPTDEWDAELWRGEEEDVTLRAFWSARVESARFLDRMQAFLFDTLAGTTEKVVGPDGVERIALRGGGRATFVRRMRETMIKEGMVTNEEEFFGVDNNDITDIRSERRLRLIYDTNIRQAYGYGQWKQGQHPAILRRFPAQKFVREREVEVPRERHEQHEGDIRLKNDTRYWADYQNDPEIGGFGVPWPPFGFNSGMGVRDVSREDAEAEGLGPDERRLADIYDESIREARKQKRSEGQKKLNLNSNLQSSIRSMDPEVKKKLKEEIRKLRADIQEKRGRLKLGSS